MLQGYSRFRGEIPVAGSPGLKCRLCNELFWNNHVLVVWEVMKSEIENMSIVQFSEFHCMVIKENLGDPLLCLRLFSIEKT